MLREIVAFFSNPAVIITSLLFAAGIFRLCHKKKISVRLCFIALGVFFLVSSNPLPALLMQGLENKYQYYQPAPTRGEGIQHVLVLGAGHTLDPDASVPSRLSAAAQARLIEGLRIHHLLTNSELIVSGYAGDSEISHARVLEEVLQALGTSSEDIRRLDHPTNTFQEASEYRRLYANDTIPLILVTSALHLQRATLIFENQGMQPIPAPADFLFKVDPATGFDWFGFSTDNFAKVQRCLHEYIGILWEKWFNHPHQIDILPGQGYGGHSPI